MGRATNQLLQTWARGGDHSSRSQHCKRGQGKPAGKDGLVESVSWVC